MHAVVALAPPNAPRIGAVTMDWRVFGLTTAIATVTAGPETGGRADWRRCRDRIGGRIRARDIRREPALPGGEVRLANLCRRSSAAGGGISRSVADSRAPRVKSRPDRRLAHRVDKLRDQGYLV